MTASGQSLQDKFKEEFGEFSKNIQVKETQQ
jgi:hypothetical protein